MRDFWRKWPRHDNDWADNFAFLMATFRPTRRRQTSHLRIAITCTRTTTNTHLCISPIFCFSQCICATNQQCRFLCAVCVVAAIFACDHHCISFYKTLIGTLAVFLVLCVGWRVIFLQTRHCQKTSWHIYKFEGLLLVKYFPEGHYFHNELWFVMVEMIRSGGVKETHCVGCTFCVGLQIWLADCLVTNCWCLLQPAVCEACWPNTVPTPVQYNIM